MRLATRSKSLSGSKTSETRNKARSLAEQGLSVINFAAGELDFDTSDSIKDAAKAAIDAGFNKYTDTLGIPALREAISRKVTRDTGVEYLPHEVGVTVGAKQGLFATMLALFEQGDEVLIPAPYWVTFPVQVSLAGARPVLLDTTPHRFQLDPGSIVEHLTPSTRGIILNTPNNPTGVVYGPELLREIGRLALRHDLWIIFDECYGALTYAPYNHTSLVGLMPELKSRTINIHSFSKTYALTGWRAGFVYGPQLVIDAIKRLQSHMTSNVTSIVQRALLVALDSRNDAFVAHVRNQLQLRRSVAMEHLRQIEGLSFVEPQGAFYVFLDVRSWLGKSYQGQHLSDSATLASVLLDQAQVAVVPGSSFGADGFLRLSYAVLTEDVIEGIFRLRRFFHQVR